MATTAELLSSVAHDIESEVRRRLEGFLGGILRAYLPQTWVFRTDQDVASLVVDRDGRASVVPGAAPSPDVTVEVGRDRLESALRARSRADPPPPGSVTVTPHTSKGKVAFDYVRPRLGL